jgi:Family of unknown function (DUF5994)
MLASPLVIKQSARIRTGSARAMTALETPTAVRLSDPRQTAPGPSDAPRLHLRSPANVGEFVDGGWWPRSLDLSVELPPLLTAMWSARYDVFRIVYNLTAWDPAPRRLIVSGRRVKLGGFRLQDKASISLVDSGGRKRIDLVVVPPLTDPVVAGRALALAGLDGDPHRAAEILDRASTPAAAVNRSGCVDLLPWADWETDGGRVLTP